MKWHLMNERQPVIVTAKTMKFSIEDFFSKKSHLLKKSLMENFIFCTVCIQPRVVLNHKSLILQPLIQLNLEWQGCKQGVLNFFLYT